MKLSKLRNILLYVFFFTLNFEVWDPLNTGGFFSISKLSAILYFISLLPTINNFLIIKNYRTLLIFISIFFGLLVSINIFFINSYSYKIFDLTLFLNIILFWFLISHAVRENSIFIKGLFLFSLGSFLLSLFYHIGFGVQYSTDNRVSLFGDNENMIGIRMAISTILLIFYAINDVFKIGLKRFFLYLPIPSMLLLMTETGSRTAFVAFLLMFLTLVFFQRSQTILPKFLTILFAVCFSILFYMFIIDQEILYQRIIISLNEGNLAGRDEIWKKIIAKIYENPFWGIGQTGYSLFSVQTFGAWKSPHNVILEVLIYSGIIGSTFFFGFLILNFSYAIKYYRRTSNQLILILLVPIFGLLLSGQLLYSKLGWVILAYSSYGYHSLKVNGKNQ